MTRKVDSIIADTDKILGGWKYGWVSFNDPAAIWKYHSTYLCWEIALVLWGMHNLWSALQATKGTHASGERIIGAKYVFFWVACVIHCFVTEMIGIAFPIAKQAWHAEGVLMLFDALPTSNLLYGSSLIFSAYVICEDVQLAWYIRPFLTGFLHVACNLAFDATGLRFVWHTWHDTDPIAGVRIYGHPIVNAIFQLGAAFFLSFFTNFAWQMRFETTQETEKGCCSYMALLLCGLLAFPATVLTHIIPFFHVFQDALNLPEETGLVSISALYFAVLFFSISCKTRVQTVGRRRAVLGRTMARTARKALLVYVAFIAIIWITSNPHKQVSIGYHEVIGPCEDKSHGWTPLGYKYEKRTFLCASNMREDRMYDLDCGGFSDPVDAGNRTVRWYAVCGRSEGGPYDSWIVSGACCGVLFLSWGLAEHKHKAD